MRGFPGSFSIQGLYFRKVESEVKTQQVNNGQQNRSQPAAKRLIFPSRKPKQSNPFQSLGVQQENALWQRRRSEE